MATNNYGAYSELTAGKGKMTQKVKIPKPKAKSYDKSNWDLKTKVSQSTIDSIKSAGMSKTLANVKSNSGNKEYVEGVRRLYGEQRLKAAMGGATAGKTAPRNAIAAGKAEASRKPLSKAVKKEFKDNNKQKFSATSSRMSGGSTSGRDTSAKVKDSDTIKMVRNTAAGFVLTGLAGAAGRKVILPAMMGLKAGKELAAGASAGAKVVSKAISKAKVGTKSEYASKAKQDAMRKIVQARIAKKAAAAKTAGKAYPGSKNVGTVNEFAKKADQTAMRKEIQARMVKKAAAKKLVKKR